MYPRAPIVRCMREGLPPGLYPDQAGQWRHWDGRRFTDDTPVPGPGTPPAPPPLHGISPGTRPRCKPVARRGGGARGLLSALFVLLAAVSLACYTVGALDSSQGWSDAGQVALTFALIVGGTLLTLATSKRKASRATHRSRRPHRGNGPSRTVD